MPDLINTLEAPGEFDALLSLRPDEPYFLLVGRDRIAPPLIDDWADKNRRRALAEYEAGTITKDERDRECRKSTQAEMIAASMVEFKNNWQARTQVAAGKPTYSGHQLPEETKRSDAIQSARIRAASTIHSAIAELAMLEKLVDPVTSLGMSATHGIANLSALAEAIEPKRPIGGVS